MFTLSLVSHASTSSKMVSFVNRISPRKTQHHVQNSFLLDAVVRLCPIIVHSICILNSSTILISKSGLLSVVFTVNCHQMDEEVDDWCHCRYFQNGMGLSCCPPDSRCKRFHVDNAWLKSKRFSQWSLVSRLIERDPPIWFVSKIF